ncbi:MAG: glycine betaine ABC transporter substrate-binding protein [Brachybacterium sp.]|nr:glycine betaine ABC transporter substrate-binding protein [Brachybacterium sp.]
MTTFRKISAALGAGVLALGAAACGDNGNGNGAAGNGAGGGETITLGYLPAWTDGLSTAYLLENQLEQMGYTVEHQELTEASVLYTGLANGDIDIYPSAWSEVTHRQYMEQYEDQVEDLGTYYDNAVLFMAVPEYTDIDSIEDLEGNADMFDGRIVGIEPSAGLTEVTQETVMPEYGLDGDYELVTSSTTAMLAELQSATDAEEDIVVTLWSPFWANTEFPVKQLEDPEGAYGEPEGLHFLGREGFSDDFPEAAEFIGDIHLSDEEYGSLENLVVNEYDEGQEPEAVEQWLEENPDAMPEMPAESEDDAARAEDVEVVEAA